MNNEKLIIVLLCVIIFILVVGVIIVSPLMNREDCNLAISHKSVDVDDSLVVVLTDSHGDKISNKTIHIILKDKNGNITEKDCLTNSKGKAKLKMTETGKYSVECSFAGDNEYDSASISKNITVKKPKTELVSQEQNSAAVHSSKYDSDGSIYPEYGPDVDSQGITREMAEANNMHYIEMTLDDGQVVGGYTAYDPVAGCYHT